MSVVMAVMVTSYVDDLTEAFTIVLMAGIIKILLGLLKIGRFIAYTPYSVISGFMSGIGVIIILLQTMPFLGAPGAGGGPIGALRALPEAMSNVNMNALAIAVVALAVSAMWPRRFRRVLPPFLAALVAGTLLGVWLTGTPLIGSVPTGLPEVWLPGPTVEVLTPDFLRKDGAIEQVVEARPDVYNHNLETVPRLYPTVRPGARYFHSLKLLDRVKQLDPAMFTKSGLMVGLGESREEVHQAMDDLRSADVDFLTVGQYLQPTPKHHPIDRFWEPAEFEDLASMAKGKGFLMVSATPLTRSSYHADRDFDLIETHLGLQTV